MSGNKNHNNFSAKTSSKVPSVMSASNHAGKAVMSGPGEPAIKMKIKKKNGSRSSHVKHEVVLSTEANHDKNNINNHSNGSTTTTLNTSNGSTSSLSSQSLKRKSVSPDDDVVCILCNNVGKE